MRTLSASQLAQLGLLLAPMVHAAGQHAAGIFGTTCWSDKGKAFASTKDCQEAIENVLKQDVNAGVGGKKNGCVEIASSGDCAVTLCDVSNEKGFVQFGAIAMAAQPIHAICKGNPSTKSTGGFNTIAGLGIKGTKQIIATVELGKKKFVNRSDKRRNAESLEKQERRELLRGTPTVPELNIHPAHPDKMKKGLNTRAGRDEELDVPGTNHFIKRIWVDDDPNFDGEDLSLEDQRTLRDTVVQFWNNAPGARTVATASLQRGNVNYTIEYTAYNNHDLTDVAQGNRANMFDQFFRMRNDNFNPSIMHAHLRVRGQGQLGTIQFSQVNMVALEEPTGSPVEDPFADPEDPFADPPNNPNGSNPFLHPTLTPHFHIQGCF